LAGFPFSKKILEGVDRYEVVESQISPDFSKEEFLLAKEKYLTNILKYDIFFIDPINLNVLSIDEHCVSLEILLLNDWNYMFDVIFLLIKSTTSKMVKI
jgi:hypothetical protein